MGLRLSSTRTSPSTCGTSVVKTRSDFSGGTITPTLKDSSMSSTLMIEIELMRTERNSIRCLLRRSSEMLYSLFSQTNRISQEPLPALKSLTDLVFTPLEEERGSFSPHVL